MGSPVRLITEEVSRPWLRDQVTLRPRRRRNALHAAWNHVRWKDSRLKRLPLVVVQPPWLTDDFKLVMAQDRSGEHRAIQVANEQFLFRGETFLGQLLCRQCLQRRQ